MAVNQLRPAQEEILAYSGGRMGVIAVPGSGKTWTLSKLAAEIIGSGVLQDDQEVLVVTLVNSAVQNFQQRVAGFLEEKKLLPYLGIRVRTLHGLAHDLVRERPGLVNLDERFTILDENETTRLRKEIAAAWLRGHPQFAGEYLSDTLDEYQRQKVTREKLPGSVEEIAYSFIRTAKDRRLSPQRLAALLEDLPLPLPLVQMGTEMYSDYQRALVYRGAVDFDDLISLAVQALETDLDFLDRCRHRWPYILEDEAQDSSRLQEQILHMLAGDGGNWVRVGDPNQAIYESFTTANPKFLRNFIHQPGTIQRHLPNSGRSTYSIIDLANHLVEWTVNAHPQPKVRDALQAPPWIEPTPPGDPQPNPADQPDRVTLALMKFSSQEECDLVARSLAKWLPENQDATVAVLASTNTHAKKMVDALKARNIEYVDGLLRSSTATRISAGVLRDLLACLADPNSPVKLAAAYRAWRGVVDPESGKADVKTAAGLIHKIARVEDYLWPAVDRDWLAGLGTDLDDSTLETLLRFRTLVQRWQAAASLPVDQLVLTLAQDVFCEPADLALAYKLAGMLRQAAMANPTWRLAELNIELHHIAENDRRFLGFSDEDSGFDPEKYIGKVVIATMHKAKGLEWDRVYLLSVNTYDFPSDPDNDEFLPDKWYLRGQLNLQAETLAQLKALLSADAYDWYQEGRATYDARLDFIRERLRLLYVGITRAKKELVITWNTGLMGNLQPAQPLIELVEFWNTRTGEVSA